MDNQNEQTTQPEENIDLDEYASLQLELNELKAKQGNEGKISRLISSYFEKRDNRPKVKINKKKHLWTAILFGWAGAHRFQAKQYVLGAIYLLLCWSGFSMAMTVVDLLVIIPMPADEDGNIEV